MKKKLLFLLTMLLMLPWAMKAQITSLNEGFESGTIPTGWTVIDADGDNHNWTPASVAMAGYIINGHNGSSDFMTSESYDEHNYTALTPNNWLVSPAVTLNSASLLSFWVCAQDNDFPNEHWGVYVSTTSATDTSSFTLLYEETIQMDMSVTSGQTPWVEHSYNLSAYTGQTIYVAFRHFNCTDMFYLNLDDVYIGPAPTCFPVANLTVSNITETSADLSWIDSTASPYAYQLEVNGVVDEIYSSSYTLSNLTAFTNYTVRMRAICTVGDTSNWTAPVTFRTQMGGNMTFSTVADGTVTNEYVPFYGYYADYYLRSQTIYPANMLTDMAGGTVSAMTFYLSNTPAPFTSTFDVKLTEVSPASFASTSFLNNSATTVYSGVLTITNNEMMIMFNTPFVYNGGNLLLEVSTATLGSVYDYTYFYGITSSSASLQGYNSSSISSISPSVRDFIPKTTFYFTGGATCLAPINLVISNESTISADISWVGRETGANYEVFVALEGTPVDFDLANWVSVGSDTSFTFTGLNPFTNYVAYVRTNCSSENSLPVSVSFRTLADCSNVTVPYTENFNGYTNISTSTSTPSGYPNVDYPVCWTFLNASTTTSDYPQAFITSNSYYVVSGNSLFFKSSSSTPLYAILPELQSSFNGLQMTFTYRNEGTSASNGTLHVGYMTSLTDTNTYVDLYACPQTTTLTEVDIYFDTVMVDPNYTYYIAFKYEGGTSNNYYASIDNVNVIEIPLCTKPSNLTSTGSSSSSVTLSWTEMGTASSWNVVYGPVGFNPDTVTTNIEYVNTTPSTTINNLIGGTPYEFYVQADCGSDVSDWRGPVTVTPGAYNMGTSGWDTLYTCGSAIYDDGGPSGVYSNSVDAYLVIYPDQPGSFVQISGTLVAESSTWDRLTIYDGVGTTNQILQTDQSSSSVTYQIPTITSTTGPLTIYFHTDGSGQYNGFEILTTCVGCVSPQLNLGLVDLDEATVNWNDYTGTQTTFEIVYGVAGFNPSTGTPDVVTGATTYTMSNLTPGTTYDVYIRSQCDDGSYATWTSTSFTTLANFPATLPYTCGFEDATENANWNFINGTQANKWCVGGFVHNTGDSALYISSNNGANNDYIENSETTVWAYRDIAFDNSSEFALSFDWRCNGESNYDYLEVYMGAPVDVVAGNSTAPTGSQLLGRFNQNTTWSHESFTISSQYANTTQRLYFMWRNDPSVGNNPAAAIDNIEVVGLTCGSPYGLAVSNTTSNSATIHFIPASSSDTQWEMALLTPNDTIDPTSVIYLQDTTYSLTNLVSGTQYRVFVRTDCGGDYSAWVGPLAFVPGSYNMHTSGWDTLYTCGAAIYDDGGSNGVYSNSVDAYLVLYPDQPGQFVQISGTFVAESSTWDRLTIYDGVGTANQILQTDQSSSSVTYQIPTITSSTGPLTIYFHTDGSGQYAGFEILTTCVSCVSPSLTVTNISTTEATLDWSSFTGSQTNFEIVYGAPTINPDNETPITVSNVNTYNITGLTATTAYVAYIRTDCGDGSYSTWNSVNFNTSACSATDRCTYTFLATDGFGDGWNGGYLTVEQNGVVMGTVEAIDHGLSSTPTTDTITVSLCDNISTSLVWHSGSFGDEVTITVIKPDGTQLYTHTDMDTYTTYTFTTDCSGSGPAVTDPTVATNAASSVGQTNATLNATITNPDGVTVTAKGFEWKATTGGTYAPIAGTGTGNTFTANLTGLTPNTSYTFKAFITFNGTTVYGTEMSFTTDNQQQETCPSPTNVQATNITESSANISWTQQGDVTTWDVNYRVAGATSWNTTTTSSNPHTLTGLTPETSYEVQVIAHCTNGVTSDPSTTITFTTNPDGINDYTLDNTVTVFPNPTTGLIQIQNAEWRMENVEVYDAYGKLLNTMNVNDHTVNLDLSGYAKGTYFVRVTTEKGVVTKRVVKN